MKDHIIHRGFVFLTRTISVAIVSGTFIYAGQLRAAESSPVSAGDAGTTTLQAVRQYDPALVFERSITLTPTEGIFSAQPASSAPFAGTTIVTEGFESTWPTGLWDTLAQTGFASCTWARTNAAADVGSWSVSPVAGTCGGNPTGPYPENVFSWMFYGPFDLSDATSAEMRFRHAIELDPNDTLLVGYSADGTSFDFPWAASQGTFAWSDAAIDLGTVLGDDSVWIAFLLQTDEIATADRGVLIDEIIIEKFNDVILSDLALQSIDVDPGPYLPGGSIAISTHVENIGSEASNSWSVDYYVSIDTTITDTDTYMGTCSGLPAINATESTQFNCLTNVPGSLANGSYFIGAILQVVDADDTNHVNHDATPILVSDDPEINVRPLSLSFSQPAATTVAQTSSNTEISQPVASTEVLEALSAVADRKGSVAVIVGFDTPVLPVGVLNAAQTRNQEQAITSAGNRLLSNMAGHNYTLKNRYRYIPFMAMNVNRAALEFLTRSPMVTHIEEDRISRPSMESSNQVIGSPLAWAEGLDGSGWAVAVLDTGVDNTHPWFAGKIASEGCYGTNVANEIESFCPGGATSSTAVDSGLHCDLSVSGCDHGTHVAGTVAGNDGAGPNYGVARGADIIAMQVFSKFLTEDDCGIGDAPCTLSRTSDQIGALERVLTLGGSMNIAAVNMSLGGGQYFDQASCDAANVSIKAAIDNLRSVGIATVIATGNDGWTDSIGAPGCVSTAISVGATTDTDNVAGFSNIYPEIHLLAPGTSIMSSVPGGGLGSKQGTSMATPHVAGAWAVMKQRSPTASVSDVLSNLQNTAIPVDDLRSGGLETAMPRFNLDMAIGTPRTTFGVFNAGPGTLSVTSIALDSPAAWISWTPSVFDVAPGELQIVEVNINYNLAPAGNSQRRLLVTSDDPDESPFPGGVFINVNATPIGGDEVFKDSFE